LYLNFPLSVLGDENCLISPTDTSRIAGEEEKFFLLLKSPRYNEKKIKSGKKVKSEESGLFKREINRGKTAQGKQETSSQPICPDAGLVRSHTVGRSPPLLTPTDRRSHDAHYLRA
jgi:hypothetical protein